MKNINKRWLALALAAILAVSSVAVGLGLTYAASPVQERFKQQNNYPTVEVNRSATFTNTGASGIMPSDATMLSATRNGNTITVNGLKEGITAISVSSQAFAQNRPYQVTNSALITGYDLANNGEINKKASDPQFDIKNSVTAYTTPWNATVHGTVGEANYIKTDSAKTQIVWNTRNASVAECTAAGLVTPISKGTAILLGEFSDRWGVPHTITFLLGVDTIVGKSLLSDLLDAITKGETILALNPNPYADAGLAELQTAVDNAETVLSSNNPTDGAINTAIDAIETAIDGLKAKGGTGAGIIEIPDGSGGKRKFKRPSGPKNIYEVLDDNGESKEPDREYIYDPDGSMNAEPPVLNGDEVPAHKDGYAYYAEEQPFGSNIFNIIDHDTGELDTSNPIWGGVNKKPGGGDDREAIKSGSIWHAEDPAGSNLWKPVKTSTGVGQGNLLAKDWVGGGANSKPTGTDNLFPVITHGGKYYAGPFGIGEDQYYVGMGTDGRFDTSGFNSTGKPQGDNVHANDEKLFWVGTGDPGDGGTGSFLPDPTGTLTITTSSLTDASAGSPYSFTLTAAGTGPITWSLASGSLPAGLTLSPAGVISGTPTAETTATFTVKATNAIGSVNKALTLTVKTGIPGLLPNTPIDTEFEIDGVKWIKIRSYNDGTQSYALLVRKENYGGIVSFCTLNKQQNIYAGSNLQEEMTNFYNGVIKGDQPTLWAAMVIPEAGLGGTTKSSMSLPTSTMAKGDAQTKDVAFALSFAEANGWTGRKNGTEYWTRTPSSNNGVPYGITVKKAGELYEISYCTHAFGLRPAVWVKVAS